MSAWAVHGRECPPFGSTIIAPRVHLESPESPESPRRRVALLDRIQQDSRAGRTYLDNETDINWTGEGIINILSGGHRNVQDRIRAFLGTVDTGVAGPTAEAVRASIDHYRNTDRGNAEALDRTYPPVNLPEAKQGTVPMLPEVAHFADTAKPQERLAAPPDHHAAYPHNPMWYDIVSPGALLRDAIWTVTGAAASLGICDRAYDPYEVILKPLIGDWAGVRGCADVFRNLADALGDMGVNALWGSQSAEAVWSGQAASGCVAHLIAVSKGLVNAQQPLRDIAQEYESAANSMNEFRNTIAALLNDIADAAIMAAASAGVAGLAGSTGVGLPIALIIGAFTLTRIYKVVNGIFAIIDTIARLDALAYATSSAQNSFGQIDSGSPLPTLPGSVPPLPK